MTRRKKYVIILTGSILSVLVIALLIVNHFLGNILERKINDALTEDERQDYHVTIDNVSVNILSGNVRLTSIKVLPDSSLITLSMSEQWNGGMIYKIEIPVLRLVGAELYDAAVKSDIRLRKIEFRKAKVSLLKGKKQDVNHVEERKDTEKVKLDSLKIEGVNGIEVGEIELSKCMVEIIDLVNQDTTLSEKEINTQFRGISIKKLSDTSAYFAFDLKHIELELKNETFEIQGGDYQLKFKRLKYSLDRSELEVSGFSMKQTYDNVYQFAKKLKVTTEIFDISVDKLTMANLNLARYVDEGKLFVDSVKVSGLDLGILMDKRLPFNEEKRPKLPNQLVKNLPIPVYVKNISILNSRLQYQERMPDLKQPMTVTLDDLDITIDRVTSIQDSIISGKPMKINLRAKLMNRARLNIDFVFPLQSSIDTFYYAGRLGPARFSTFNKAAFPALGMRFTSGKINSITFTGSASPGFNRGEFTMLYENLSAEVSKKDLERKSRFFTWAANTALKSNNPGKNGITRHANMGFDRVYYKGFGNLMWKTFQNGILNTILPMGNVDKNSIKEQKEKKKRSSKIKSKSK